MKLKVKNWADFQHYKGRKPPWIKLHRDLLDNYQFFLLPVESRALAPLLWLIASENLDGSINLASEALAFRLHMSSEALAQALKPLIERGFIVCEQDASNVLAPCLQHACPEAEAEAEAEERQKQQAPQADFAAAAAINGHGLYSTEAHASRFSFEQIKAYCKSTKRISSPGGLARTLFRTGEEDEDVGEWVERERRRGCAKEAQVLVGPNDDFRLPPRERSGAWGIALDEIERRIGEAATITWFEPLRFDEEAGALIAPDPVFREWIENNYREALDAGLEQAGLGRLAITSTEKGGGK